MAARINREELLFSNPPYSCEYIVSRERERWRIFDRFDNSVGAADTQDEALAEVARLNARRQDSGR